MNEEYLRNFLKEHLYIQVWVDYDAAYTPQINVGLYLDDEKICEESDYLNL